MCNFSASAEPHPAPRPLFVLLTQVHIRLVTGPNPHGRSYLERSQDGILVAWHTTCEQGHLKQRCPKRSIGGNLLLASLDDMAAESLGHSQGASAIAKSAPGVAPATIAGSGGAECCPPCLGGSRLQTAASLGRGRAQTQAAGRQVYPSLRLCSPASPPSLPGQPRQTPVGIGQLPSSPLPPPLASAYLCYE
jgi:hypothetical protein